MMEINAARFLAAGNTLEVWLQRAPQWRYYSIGHHARRVTISSAGNTTLDQTLIPRHKRLALALGHLTELEPAMPWDWWRRRGVGNVVDVIGFCKAGHRLVYWPDNWDQFCHVNRISPLVFMGWDGAQFYVAANADRQRYQLTYTTASPHAAMACAARTRVAREALVLGPARLAASRDARRMAAAL